MISFNKEYFKRTSSYVAIGALFLPTIVGYIPMLSGFGIPESILGNLQAFLVVCIIAAQLVTFSIGQKKANK